MARLRIHPCLLALIAFVVVPIGSCGIFSGLFPGGTGTLRLLITDKPFPTSMLCSAVVRIERIDVRLAHTDDDDSASQPSDDANEPPEDDAADTEDDAADRSSHSSTAHDGSGDGAPSAMMQEFPEMDHEGFITITTHGRAFDLLNLRNGKTDLLADTEIPAGTYDQMRLVVSGGEVTIKNGADCTDNTTTCALKVPSGEESGIKLNFTFQVTQGQQTPLLLDIDLSRAFQLVPSGPDNVVDPTNCGFHFHPSFAMRLIHLLEAGSISGHVTNASDQSAVGGATVTAFDGTDEVTSTTTDQDGAYMLLGLHTASYRVHVEATGFVAADVNDVAVTAGQDTPNVDVALTPTGP